jgi:cysteine desulfurase / selenocysteine lyase
MSNALEARGNGPAAAFDAARVEAEFPILAQQVNGHPLVYLDSAATTQKPAAVLAAMDRYYREDNANIHRGVHTLSARATRAYESARCRVQSFLGAGDSREIIFTRGTTEAVNLVARSFARPRLAPGDEILVTEMEHHSNIVPWQIIAAEAVAKLRVVPFDDRGELIMSEFEKLLGQKTRLVAVAHVSNALGTVNPVREIIEAAHARGVPVLVDGAQAAAHMPVNVRGLGCDFYAISGHKIYGPTGIGALYGRRELLEAMPPYQGGGDMIKSVTFEETVYNDLPYKFEAGTPDIAGAIGLGAALEWLSALGLDAAAAHERRVIACALEKLAAVPGLCVLGAPRERAGVISFTLGGIHPHDIGTVLDQQGIAIRTGHHCAQPVMDHFDIPASARASFGVYNTLEDVDALVLGLKKVIEVFGG